MQQVLKLEKKNLVERYMKSNSNKKVFLKLTPKGIKASAGHEKYHQKMNDDLQGLLKNLKLARKAKK